MEFIGYTKRSQDGNWDNGFLTSEGIETINRKANEYGLRIKIGRMRKPTAKGYTHYIALDEYNRGGQQNQQNNYQHKYSQSDNPRNQNTDLSDNYGPVGLDDIPF